MSEYCDVGLEDRLRSTYRAVTSATAYGPPPPIAGAPRKRRAPKRFLLFAGALLLVLAIVGAVAALSGIGDSTRIRRPLRPVEQQSLFPDVVPHQGPELLLAPQQVPDGYQLLYATGPDPTRPGSRAGSSVSTTLQQWVKLDAARVAPLAGFTLSWGPQDLADSQLPIPRPTIGHQDALTAYGNAEPITVNGYRGVWAEYVQTVAWEQDGKVISISGQMDNWTGKWSEHLTRSDLEAIASTVVRLDDGTYRVNTVPAGYQLAATTLGFTSPGNNERRLVYSDGNGHGLAIQLVDNTQDPPGVALGLGGAGARLVTVRGQRAVQTQFLNGGDGSGCVNIDTFLCAIDQPGVLTNNYVQWLEPDTTRVTLTGVGVSGDQLLQVARSLEQVSPQHWEDLTKPTDSVPCALRARCK